MDERRLQNTHPISQGVFNIEEVSQIAYASLEKGETGLRTEALQLLKIATIESQLYAELVILRYLGNVLKLESASKAVPVDNPQLFVTDHCYSIAA